jgi:hypothetical protein
MKHSWLFLTLALAFPVHATGQASWNYVYVVRATSLETKAGPATVARDGEHFTGKLIGADGDIPIEGHVKGSEANAVVGLESSKDRAQFIGKYYQATAPDGSCRQTIQLLNGPNSLTLARNFPRCEP